MAPDVLTVRTVAFAPVKGMRHLPQPAASFDAHGPIGDRRWCVVDVERRRVLKTVENPSLLAVEARLDGDLLELVLPDGRVACAAPERAGETVTCSYWGRPVEVALTQGPHAALLSSWLGRPVRLAEAPRGGVVYGAPLTLGTTASLADLGARSEHADLVAEAARFRATLLVETRTPYVEESWAGQETTVAGIRVRVGEPVGRCAVVDLDPLTGRRDARLLRALAGYRRTNGAGEPCFGVYAELAGARCPAGGTGTVRSMMRVMHRLDAHDARTLAWAP